MADRVVKYTLKGDIAQFGASMKAAGASVGKLADDLTKADARGAKFRKGLTSVGDTAGKVGLAAAAGLGAMVLVTAKFDKQMSEVQAATGETAANMDKLRQAAIDAGAATAFSASEAAQGVTELAKAGVSTADILGGGLAGALDLAAAGQIGVGEAAEYSAKAMTQFNLEGSQVPHVADLMAAAAGKAVGEVGDFGQALNQVGLVASQTGLTIEDTVGTLAAFAQAGLQGSDAGTAFKSMLQRLQNPLGQGAKAMEQLGINAYDANGNFIGITEVAQQLQEKMGGLDQATRDAAMAQIFGSDAVRAASILYREGADGIQGWIDKTDDAGFAAEQAAAKMDNLAGDWEEFTGSLETALIGAGEGSQGALRGLVQNATDLVNAFNDMSPAAKNTAVALTAITAVTGGGLWFGAKVIQGVANTRLALDNLGISAKGAGKALGALGLAATAIYATNRALTALEQASRDSVPGVEALTDSLLNLHDVEVARQLTKDLGDVGAALDRITDPGTRAQAFDWMHNAGKQVGFIASMAEKAAGGMGSFGEEIALSSAEAEAAVSALDEAMANIATTGGTAAAEDALARLATTYGLTGDEVDALIARMPMYEEALAGISNNESLAAGGADELAGELSAVGDSAGEAAAEVYTLQNALDLLFGGAVNADAAMVEWRRGLREMVGELKGGDKALSAFTKRGQDNRDTIRGQVEDLRTWAEAQYEVDGSTTALTRRLLKGREAIIAQAKAAGLGEKATRSYLKEMGLTPKEIRTAVRLIGADKAEGDVKDVKAAADALEKSDPNVKVTADASQALSAIGATRAALAALRDKRVIVTTEQHTIHRSPVAIARAEGGVVSGPGTATSDSIPALLSNGEYVVKAAAVAKYGVDTLHRLNAMRLADGGHVQRFAAGGKVEPLTRSDFKDFDLRRGLGVKGIRDELKEFRKAIRASGRDWTKSMQRMSKQATVAARGLSAHSKQLSNNRDKLKDLRGERKDFRNQVAGSWDNDIFGNGVAGLRLQLEADRNDSRSMLNALKAADRRGLSGGLEKALIGSGDLNTAQQIAQMSRGEINKLEQLFAQRTQAQNQLGKFGGAEVYGAQMAQASKVIDRLERQVARQTKVLNNIEARIERGAATGTARGMSDRNRATQQRKKAGR